MIRKMKVIKIVILTLIIGFSFVAGSLNSMNASTENGNEIKWENVNPGAGGQVQDVILDPSIEGRLFFLSDMEGVYRSDDNGLTWKYKGAELYRSTYVTWAAEKGIIVGYGNKTFGCGNSISRQEMATMFERYMRVMNIKLLTKNETPLPFEDDDEIIDWAKDAVVLMQKTGLMEGVGVNAFSPKKAATRAAAATFIQRLTELLAQ